MSLLLAQVEQLSVDLELKHAELCRKDAEIAQITEDLEAKDEQCSSVAVEYEKLNAKRAQYNTTLNRLKSRLGGRKPLQRSDAELKCLSTDQAAHAKQAMANRLSAVMGVHGEAGAVSLSAVMRALSECGFLEWVWESKELWEYRMTWVEEQTDILAFSWDPQLTFRLKTQLNLSEDKVDQLRYALSHHRVGKRLVPRTWFINPWTGAKMNFPQPIKARTQWTPLVKAFITEHGLHMDSTGTIAQRSFARVVREQHACDVQRGYLTTIPEEGAETVLSLIPVLGADGFSVGNNSMMHVGVSLAPSYRAGIAQQNEINMSTVATSRTDDHWSGLNTTLVGGYYAGDCDALPPDSIAAEFNQMYTTKKLSTPDGEIDVDPAVCPDLAAARGFRGGRGKCACHTAAETSEERASMPELAEECDWEEAAKVLNDVAPFLKHDAMRADSHTPPAGWNYALGPWACKRPGCCVSFASHAQWVASVKELKKLKNDKSEAGKKAAKRRADNHKKLHAGDQAEHEPPILYPSWLAIWMT